MFNPAKLAGPIFALCRGTRRSKERNQIVRCILPNIRSLVGRLRMTVDREAILLICQPILGLESSHPKLGSLGEFLPQRFVFLFLMLAGMVRRSRETHT
jgi:hypothetical protein